MSAKSYEIAAYFPEWGDYTVKDLQATGSAEQITLINYAFAIPKPGPDGSVTCTIADPVAAYARAYSAAESLSGAADAPGQALRGHFNQIKLLKARYPELRVVVSVGGWTGSGWFSPAASTPESRERFVASCVDTFLLGNLPEVDDAGGPGVGAGVFDGIDIDWEYPAGGGLPDNKADERDSQNFALLLQEFRKQYAGLGRSDLLLTAAVPSPAVLADQYDMASAHALLDLVAVMTYDLRGAWSPLAGHHTNLYPSSLDPTPSEERLSADTALHYYQEVLGVPPAKLLIGAAFYGHGWKDVSEEQNGLFQANHGEAGGPSGYRDLAGLTGQGYTRFWDDSAQAPWLYNLADQVFWSYDDPQSVEAKARYARENGLAGVMFWEISGDDDAGSLVQAINRGLKAK